MFLCFLSLLSSLSSLHILIIQYPCSNQGTCNAGTGECLCFFSTFDGEVNYRFGGSDGNGNPGLRPDCGYAEEFTLGCLFAGEKVCGVHSYCSNSTGKCECHEGWFGVDCSLTTCPTGLSEMCVET